MPSWPRSSKSWKTKRLSRRWKRSSRPGSKSTPDRRRFSIGAQGEMTMDQNVQSGVYDVEAIRRDFPILSTMVHGKPLVYLDNGASAQKPQVVIDAISHAYSAEYANVHRGLHHLSNAATEAYEAAREKVRRFLNAGSIDEIVFTKNSTEAIN